MANQCKTFASQCESIQIHAKSMQNLSKSSSRAALVSTPLVKSIFGRFRLVARKLRCIPRTSFYNVLLNSYEIRTKRAWAPTNPKIELLCPPKSRLGASAKPKIKPERPNSSEKARAECLRGLRKFIRERERGDFERESASASGQERAGARGPRAVISEFSNGC